MKTTEKSAKGEMSFLLFRESSVPVTRPSLLPPLVENRVASPGPSYRQHRPNYYLLSSVALLSEAISIVGARKYC